MQSLATRLGGVDIRRRGCGERDEVWLCTPDGGYELSRF